ncbi:MAG TPA: metallophosphoesterase [Ktedonobacteraceae bacterium]|nr:metallophosphoesterase [Ktedonobacteraceae bacterium]
MTEHHVEGSLGNDPASDQEEQQNSDIITVVLTSDNHLGDTAFSQNPRKLEERQQRLRRAFQQATDFALGQGVDLFIQAGDLFDTPVPLERDRSFVAARLAQLKQAGVRTFALGGVHDTPLAGYGSKDEDLPAPQMSYARLGALHYFPPQPGIETSGETQAEMFESQQPLEPEPVILTLHGVQVGICGLGVLAGQEGDILSRVRLEGPFERVDVPIMVLHAALEGLTSGSTLLDTRALVSRQSIQDQPAIRYLLVGYQHKYEHFRVGKCEVVVAGSTQRIEFGDLDSNPGFVFLGLAADGIRWCKHISLEAAPVHRLTLQATELWPEQSANDEQPTAPTEIILERLRPLCTPEAMVQLRLEGELTRSQYHQLDLNQIRHYGEQNCFALAIDDSTLSLLPEQETVSIETGERFSPRAELVAMVDEWIAATDDESEKRGFAATREELLSALDEVKGKR